MTGKDAEIDAGVEQFNKELAELQQKFSTATTLEDASRAVEQIKDFIYRRVKLN